MKNDWNMNKAAYLILAIAIAGFVLSAITLFQTSDLRVYAGSISKSHNKLVDEWNDGWGFILPQIATLKMNQEDIYGNQEVILEHVGLEEVDGELKPFSMDCTVEDTAQHPVLLKCNRKFGEGN